MMSAASVRLHTDELFSEHAYRALGYTTYGGADIGEVLSTMARITATDAELWYREWRATADRTRRAGFDRAGAGDAAAARSALLRASNYYRTAGILLIGPEVDPRFVEVSHLQVSCFRDAVATLSCAPEVIEIPYDGITMPGYFFRVDDSGIRRPTMILTDGYDGSVEELMFASGFAALERGYNVLAFDGPGQGAMIVDRGVHFRPDWENVVTPVVDFALRYREVDPDRLVLQGLSFGGYLAPRAATREHRFAACISDCGPYDLRAALESRIPSVLLEPRFARLLDRLLRRIASQVSRGWALRRGMWVHGVADPLDYVRLSGKYSLRGLERLITCPTLVIAAENDDLSSRQKEFFDALICPKEYLHFTAAEGGDHHCEAGARRLYNERVFAWLDATIGTP